MSARFARRARAACLGAIAAHGAACSPIEETVFEPLALEPGSPFVVPEGAGAVELALRLRRAPPEPLGLAYRIDGIEAQNGCQSPDFEAAEGRVEWPAGALEAPVRMWVGDDDLAELDERFEIRLSALPGSTSPFDDRVEVVIADDDRSAVIDAQARGVLPGSNVDQAPALQALCDEAGALGRAVLSVAPGDYQVSSLDLHPGTTLSARGARFHRPPESPREIVTLNLEHAGAEASPASLIEGLTIDGRRDEQGPYRDREREEAHLIALAGDADAGGRLRATLERLTLVSGTGSGVMIRSDADTTICDVSASALWRDAVSVVGGASSTRLKNLDATATEGTGLWLGPRSVGSGGRFDLAAEVENANVGAGDVEIEATADSRVTLRGLVMTRPPLRVDAPGGVVRIASSVLMLGLPSEAHNHWGVAHDVEIADSTVVVSESVEDGAFEEAARVFAAVSVGPDSMASGSPAPGAHRLLFERCRFELAPDVEADDSVYAIENRAPDTAVVVRASTLGAGFAGFFAPECAGCELEP